MHFYFRTLIEKSFKGVVTERTERCLTKEAKKLIDDYNKAMTQRGANNFQFNWNRNRNRNGADFCSGFLFMLGIVTVSISEAYMTDPSSIPR